MPAPNTIYLKEYLPPRYLVDNLRLEFDLHETHADVFARLLLRLNPAGPGPGPLVLNGQDLELRGLRLDGRALEANEFEIDGDTLTISEMPESGEIEIETRIKPQENTALEGLYQSGGNFCTQCEAEGFRRITYYPDRPDVMARFSTCIEAEKARYPVLLSNGNLVEAGELGNGRHFALWEDPFPKPSYLFALVAGNLAQVADTFTTRSGREVALHIYVQQKNLDKVEHAMRSLKLAMRWDEERFGREYDLDIFQIVAVDDFNMGAMENKGLNIFNSKYVLAKPETATDSDFEGIESVIGHEYFHNWTGNRITCRDWFQLSLKEGLTVFRDQEFSADMGSRAVRRIQDVRALRSMQFAEDAGPMAHPVRPESYIEINNFYTATVYEKGAEVIRMIHTLLGREGFRRGMDLYFARHDGQAVTTEYFVAAMADANEVDFGQFQRWYHQAGTPEVSANWQHDADNKTFTLSLSQRTPPTPGQPEKLPLHIPIAMALLDPGGREMPLRLVGEIASAGTSRVLELREAEQTFRFVNVAQPPVPSLLRGFSAPVRLAAEYTDQDLVFLLAHDTDAFCRWEAGQQMAIKAILSGIQDFRSGRRLAFNEALADAVGRILVDDELDPAFAALLLALPSETYLADLLDVVDVEGIHVAREFLRQGLAMRLKDVFLAAYRRNSDQGPYLLDPEAVGRRALRNAALNYLMSLEEPDMTDLALRQYHSADNMTDSMAALTQLAHRDNPVRREALDDFHARWREDALVLDKWFAIQATAPLPGVLDEVRQLMQHPAFEIRNPNKVRALIGSFARSNPTGFHDASGEGYAFVAEQVIQLNALNPQIAARLLGAFNAWRRYDPQRRALMQAQLERILQTPALSPDVYEVASKSLA